MPKKSSIISHGSNHYLLLGVAIFAFVGLGVYFLRPSHAATPPTYQFLNYQSAAQTAGVTNVTVDINSIGSQTVSQVAPGGELDYLVGGKVPIKTECYYVQVVPQVGGPTTAKASFTAQGRAITVNLPYVPNSSGLQSVCVDTANTAPKAYNVANLSPSNGPNILVYQDIIRQ